MAAPVAPPPTPAPAPGGPGRFERALDFVVDKLESVNYLNNYGLERVTGTEEEVYNAKRQQYVELSARFRRHAFTPVMKNALEEARDDYLDARHDLFETMPEFADDEERQKFNVDEYISLEHDIADSMVQQVENKRFAKFYDTIWTKRGVLGKVLISAGVGVVATAAIPFAGAALGATTAGVGALFGTRLTRRAVTGKLKKEAGITQLAEKRRDHNVARFNDGGAPDKITQAELADSLRTAERKESRRNKRTVIGTAAAVLLLPRVVEIGKDAAGALVGGAWDMTKSPREFVFRGVPDWMPIWGDDGETAREALNEAKDNMPEVEAEAEADTDVPEPEVESTTPTPETDEAPEVDLTPWDGEDSDGVSGGAAVEPDSVDGTVSGGADVPATEMTREQQIAEFNRIIEANGWTQQQGIDVLNISSERARQISELMARGMTAEEAAEIADRNFANLS